MVESHSLDQGICNMIMGASEGPKRCMEFDVFDTKYAPQCSPDVAATRAGVDRGEHHQKRGCEGHPCSMVYHVEHLGYEAGKYFIDAFAHVVHESLTALFHPSAAAPRSGSTVVSATSSAEAEGTATISCTGGGAPIKLYGAGRASNSFTSKLTGAAVPLLPLCPCPPLFSTLHSAQLLFALYCFTVPCAIDLTCTLSSLAPLHIIRGSC